MAELLEAGYDLGAIAAIYVAIGILLLVGAIVGTILRVIDVKVGPWRPFHGLVTKAENSVTGELNNWIKGMEKQAAKFEAGLVTAFTLLVGIPILLAVALKALLTYLWHSAIGPFVHAIADPIAKVARDAASDVTTLTGTVADNLTAAKKWATDRASDALGDAKAYADHWLDHAVAVLNTAIAAALAKAESYADTAVGKLRAAEDAAVAAAVGLAVEAKNAGINAAAAALGTAEGEINSASAAALAAAAGALTTAESYADAVKREALTAAGGALVTAEGYAERVAAAAAAGEAAARAQAEGAITASVDAVKAIAIDVGHDLGTIEGDYGVIGLAALIASIPAIATLVHALASETGLENRDCREKVKGICATPSNLWGDLLGGLAAIGFAFSLLELAEVADPLLVELAPVIVKAA